MPKNNKTSKTNKVNSVKPRVKTGKTTTNNKKLNYVLAAAFAVVVFFMGWGVVNYIRTGSITASASSACSSYLTNYSTTYYSKKTLPTLRKGSTGSCVRFLQMHLKENNVYPYRVDGSFGSVTELAVRTYQRRERLVVDGVVGNQTWSRMLPKDANN